MSLNRITFICVSQLVHRRPTTRWPSEIDNDSKSVCVCVCVCSLVQKFRVQMNLLTASITTTDSSLSLQPVCHLWPLLSDRSLTGILQRKCVNIHDFYLAGVHWLRVRLTDSWQEQPLRDTVGLLSPNWSLCLKSTNKRLNPHFSHKYKNDKNLLAHKLSVEMFHVQQILTG